MGSHIPTETGQPLTGLKNCWAFTLITDGGIKCLSEIPSELEGLLDYLISIRCCYFPLDVDRIRIWGDDNLHLRVGYEEQA